MSLHICTFEPTEGRMNASALKLERSCLIPLMSSMAEKEGEEQEQEAKRWGGTGGGDGEEQEEEQEEE
eukprot:764302-Hanusia_phi.AAC.1